MFLFLFFIFSLCLQEVKHEQSRETSSRVDKVEPRRPRREKQNDQPTIPDARVRQLKDQLIRAKVYLSLPATRNNPHFTRELRLRVKEVQRAVGDASKDSDLPKKYVAFRDSDIACFLSFFLFSPLPLSSLCHIQNTFHMHICLCPNFFLCMICILCNFDNHSTRHCFSISFWISFVNMVCLVQCL